MKRSALIFCAALACFSLAAVWLGSRKDESPRLLARIVGRADGWVSMQVTNRTREDYYFSIRAEFVDGQGKAVREVGDPAARYSVASLFLRGNSLTNLSLRMPPQEKYACQYRISYESTLGRTEIAIMRWLAELGLPYPFYPRGVRSYPVEEKWPNLNSRGIASRI